jgi:hypothetical protein
MIPAASLPYRTHRDALSSFELLKVDLTAPFPGPHDFCCPFNNRHAAHQTGIEVPSPKLPALESTPLIELGTSKGKCPDAHLLSPNPKAPAAHPLNRRTAPIPQATYPCTLISGGLSALNVFPSSRDTTTSLDDPFPQGAASGAFPCQPSYTFRGGVRSRRPPAVQSEGLVIKLRSGSNPLPAFVQPAVKQGISPVFPDSGLTGLASTTGEPFQATCTQRFPPNASCPSRIVPIAKSGYRGTLFTSLAMPLDHVAP